MNIYYDEPIAHANDDLYGRSALAGQCAEILSSVKSDNAYVMGLSGSWGLGKTSFLNMVKEKLEAIDNNPTIVEFNPWLYSSHEQLIKEFFNQLMSALGIEGASRLGKTLIQYSDAIASAGVTALSIAAPQVAELNAAIPFANSFEAWIIGRVVKRMGEKVSPSEKTLVRLKNEIQSHLAKRDKNIIVLVDDVDRLSSEDVRLLFKLVNNAASFPRMTFLLSYDKAVVTSSLSRVQDIDGTTYLEKIVQLQLALPPLTKDDIRRHLSSKLDLYIESQQTFKVDGSERSRLLRVFETFVLNPISTPRQLKRYLNALEVAAITSGEEICPTDVIGMVGLGMFFPNLMRWVIEHRGDVCSGGQPMLRLDNSDYAGLSNSLERAIAKDAGDGNDAREALYLLFPRISQFSGQLHYSQTSVSRETGRVANIENLQRFLGMVGDSEVSRSVLYRLMVSADVDELSEGLLALDCQGQLGRFTELVQSERHGLNDQRKEAICRAILLSIGRFNQSEVDGFIQWSAFHKASALLLDLFAGLGVDCADAIMLESLEELSTKDIIGLGWFLRDERLAQNGEGGSTCLSDGVYRSVSSRYVKAIVDGWPRVLRMPHLHSKFLWRAIDRDIDGKMLAEVRRLYDGSPEMRVLCMAAVLSHWISGSEDGYSLDGTSDSSYEPILTIPTVQEVRAYGVSDDFAQLPDDMKLRVAALYILLVGDDEMGFGINELRATSSVARALVDEWLGKSA